MKRYKERYLLIYCLVYLMKQLREISSVSNVTICEEFIFEIIADKHFFLSFWSKILKWKFSISYTINHLVPTELKENVQFVLFYCTETNVFIFIIKLFFLCKYSMKISMSGSTHSMSSTNLTWNERIRKTILSLQRKIDSSFFYSWYLAERKYQIWWDFVCVVILYMTNECYIPRSRMVIGYEKSKSITWHLSLSMKDFWID